MRNLRLVLAVLQGPTSRHRYGRHRCNRADLHLPPGPGPHRVAILIHGGSWKARYSRRMMRAVARDLTSRGWAAWNIEYRRVGRGQGGGWPATFEDGSIYRADSKEMAERIRAGELRPEGASSQA